MIKTRPSNVNNKPYEVAEDSYLTLSNGDTYFIHEFYLTDYASIPSVLKFFLEWKGQEADAYIVHDSLYHYQGYRTFRGSVLKKTKRKWADKEMKWHMKRLGSPRWRYTLYYIAVRAFGWKSYGNV